MASERSKKLVITGKETGRILISAGLGLVGGAATRFFAPNTVPVETNTTLPEPESNTTTPQSQNIGVRVGLSVVHAAGDIIPTLVMYYSLLSWNTAASRLSGVEHLRSAVFNAICSLAVDVPVDFVLGSALDHALGSTSGFFAAASVGVGTTHLFKKALDLYSGDTMCSPKDPENPERKPLFPSSD